MSELETMIRERIEELKDCGLPSCRTHLHESYLLNRKCKECDEITEENEYILAVKFIIRELQDLLERKHE